MSGADETIVARGAHGPALDSRRRLVHHRRVHEWVFFDVDRTVLATDSFVRVFARGLARAPWRVLLLALVWPLLLAPLWGGDWRWPKSALLWTITAGRSPRAALGFLRSTLLPDATALWRPDATAALARWRARGVRVCYVSASPTAWLRPLLRRLDGGPHRVIGSRLRCFAGGVVIAGPDCRGHEKLRRVDEALGPALWLCAYSDHPHDAPLLARAAQRVVVNPRPEHVPRFTRALAGGFEVVTWRDP